MHGAKGYVSEFEVERDLRDADEDLDDPTVRLWRDRRAVNVTELERLNAICAGPLAEVPLMAMDPGPALVGAVARQIENQLRSA